MENALLYLPNKKVEELFEIDKKVKPDGFAYGKHNFNSYWNATNIISNFLAEVINVNDMCKMLK